MKGSCIDLEWLKNHPLPAHPIKPKKMSGYPAFPGTGPKGETCGTCHNLHRNEMSKTYFKCVIMKQFWTGGGGTDVKFRSPACSYFTRATERERIPH